VKIQGAEEHSDLQFIVIRDATLHRGHQQCEPGAPGSDMNSRSWKRLFSMDSLKPGSLMLWLKGTLWFLCRHADGGSGRRSKWVARDMMRSLPVITLSTLMWDANRKSTDLCA
jgi:hypothetical protein